MFTVQFVCEHEDNDQLAMLLASLIAAAKTHSIRSFDTDVKTGDEAAREVINTLVRTEDIKKSTEWLLAPRMKKVDFLWNDDQVLIFRTKMTMKSFLEYGAYLARLGFSLSCSFDGSEHIMEFWPSAYSNEDIEHYKAPVLLVTPKEYEAINLRT